MHSTPLSYHATYTLLVHPQQCQPFLTRAPDAERLAKRELVSGRTWH